MAVSSANAKIAALNRPPAAALRAAASRTFSKTRGTPRIVFGAYRSNWAEMVPKSDQCACAAPPSKTASDTARASTCASGRKVRTRLPGLATSPIDAVRMPRTSL